MSLLTQESFSKIAETLLLNAYAVMPAGFANGKAGISLTLFELAKFTNNKSIENHAYNLLQEILTYNITGTDFNHGKAGIGFTIDYLISDSILDADYIELYQTEHKTILEEICRIEYIKKDCLKYADYIFFINSLSNHFTEEELNDYNRILFQHIYLYLNEEFNEYDIETYYLFVSRLLSICNVVSLPQSVIYPLIQYIQKNEERLGDQDFICTSPLYNIKKIIFNELNPNSFPQEYDPTTDIIVECLNMKERIDLIYDIYRLYALNKRCDYRDFAKNIQCSITDENLIKQKQILLSIFASKTESMFGIEMGLSRILLLHMNWKSINQGMFTENRNRLFI